MTINRSLDFYENNYDLIHNGIYSSGPNELVSVGEDCRFCGKTKEETTFKHVSHGIPECLGNNQLVTKDECDGCNSLFSNTIENHLDKFTKPFRIVGQIKGKRGIPNYRSNDRRSRISFTDVMEVSFKDPETFVTVDEENKQLRVMVHREAYIPHLAYKALIKIALSTLDSEAEFQPFAPVARWLVNPDAPHIMRPELLLQTFIPGPRPTNGVASFFFRRKKSVNNVPYAFYVIAFGNVSLQIMVPSLADEGRTIDCAIPFFPTPFEFIDWPYGELARTSLDMTSTDLVRNQILPLTYSFDSIREIDPSER